MKRALLALLALAAGSVRGQTLLGQEQRLIDIHALLLDLPPVDAPGTYRAGQLGVGLEVIGVPPIDGSTGTPGVQGFKRQITASDRTAVFPRPRVTLGLPAPESFRAFVGASYVPPVEVRSVSLHYVGGEAGIAYVPGPFTAGIRAHLLYAQSESPVTDPVLRDRLRVTEYGAEVSAGYALEFGALEVTPYGGAGVSRTHGNFRVTSDGVTLTSDDTAAALQAGVRLVFGKHWLGVAELDAYPGRLVHPNFRLAYLFDVF
ncbi:MAG TPA: outer membrane beta-barrel protein [Myxococcales bacterium]